MDNYEILELEDDTKYIIVMSLKNKDKEYVLAAQINDSETEISKESDIFIRDRRNNIIKKIEDNFEYDLIKSVFEKKLESIWFTS